MLPHLECSLDISLEHSLYGHVSYVNLGNVVPYNEIYLSDSSGVGREFNYITNPKLLSRIEIFHESPDTFPIKIWNKSIPCSYVDLFYLQYLGFPVGQLILSNLIDKFKVSQPPISDCGLVIQTMLSSYLSVFNWTLKRLYASESTVLVFNGRYINTGAVVHAASSLGLKILYHDRGGSPDKYFLSDQPVQSLTKRISNHDNIWSLTTNKNQAYSIGKREFELRARRENSNWIDFSANQTPDVLPFLPQDKTIVTFFGGSSHEVRAYLNHNVFPPSPWSDQFSLLSDLLGMISSRSDYHLFY